MALFPEALQRKAGQLEINFREIATVVDNLCACCSMGHSERDICCCCVFVVFKVGFTTPSVEPNWGLELTTLGLRPEWRSRLEYWTWTHWATQNPPKWDIWTTCQKNRSDCPLPAPTPAEDASSLASRHLLTDRTWDLDTGFISCSTH